MKTLDSFDFPANSNRRAGGYDWDALLDGRIHQLERGDYKASKPKRIANTITRQARKRGLAVRIHIDDATGAVTFQAFKAEASPAPAPAPEAEEAPRRTRGRK